MIRPHCRTCCCQPRPLVINVDAPFYPLVLLIDALTDDARGISLRRRREEAA